MSADGGQEIRRLRRQVEVMLAHALDRGLSPAPQPWIFEAAMERAPLFSGDDEPGWSGASNAWEASELTALVRAHRELARLVAPARPASLVLLDDHRRAGRPPRVAVRDAVRALPRARVAPDGATEPGGVTIPPSAPTPPAGTTVPPGTPPQGTTTYTGSRLFLPLRRPAVPSTSLPVVRRLILATGGFLGVFVLLAAVPAAREATVGEIADFAAAGSARSFGDLLLRELFLLAAAGLGASITALFTVNREITRGTYDPDLDLAVLQRVLIGMTCGLVLAELLPVPSVGGGDGIASLVVPAVALLGGFAASLVQRVLTRMVTAVESLFAADPDEQEEQRRQLEQRRAEEALTQLERSMLGRLLEIRRIASSGAPSRTVVEEVDKLVADVAHV